MAELYLLRHAIAEERRPGIADESRRLTPEGRKKLRSVLKTARAAGVRPATIVSSPLVRAVQTAKLAGEILGGELKEDAALSPGSTPEAVVDAARKLGAASVMLVGHEPLLGETATFLLQAGAAVIEFKKGTLACFETDLKHKRHAAVLKWLLSPKIANGVQHSSGGKRD